MSLVLRIAGIVALLVLGTMFLVDYWKGQEAENAVSLTVAEVKRVGTRDLPEFFILKDAVRKNLASVQYGSGVSAETMYPVYTREEAIDTAFDATLRNEAVVFVTEPLRTDTALIQVHALFQPVSYRVTRMDGTLTMEARRLFSDQDILVAKGTILLARDYAVQEDVLLVYGVLCFTGTVIIGILTWFQRTKQS